MQDAPEDSLAELIANTGRAVRRSLHMRLAQFGVRGGSWYVLKNLYRSDGMTQRELSQRVGMTGPSMMELLRTMEKEELVARSRDPDDQRKVRVHLTDRAREMLPRLAGIAESVNEVMLAGFTPPEEVALRILLNRIGLAVQADQERLRRIGKDGETIEDRYF